jgi:hypothetical protein
MENNDAGSAVTNVVVAADPLTDHVQRVNFWRPARIAVTDAVQGKVLVPDQEGPGGFVAVSRAPGRGELRVVAQSLWWNWLKADPAQVDNAQLTANLLQRCRSGSLAQAEKETFARGRERQLVTGTDRQRRHIQRRPARRRKALLAFRVKPATSSLGAGDIPSQGPFLRDASA